MVDPIFIVAIATVALSSWQLAVGRPLFRRPTWNLSERGHRLYGACSLALSLLAIALALTYPTGLAFMTYGIGTLALVGATQLVTRRKATI